MSRISAMNNIEGPIVAKFGGTSVATKKAILTIIEIVRQNLNRRPILVVSAVRGVTDALLKRQVGVVYEIHQKLINDLFPNREIRTEVMNYVDYQLRQVEAIVQRETLTSSDIDELVSFGEIISSYIVSQSLRISGIPSEQVIASRLIITDDNFMQADFLPEETKIRVRNILTPIMEKGIVPVVTGFIGSTRDGRITTLGRGGSDYSAAIIGYSLRACEIQIWTDVDGVFTADPRVVKSARLLPVISYEQAFLLAESGAKVLHPKTMGPALKGNIPIRVLNTFNISNSGTLVTRIKGG